MTDNNHPITPPPEFVEQWDSECESDVDAAMYLATQAARWGADQELEACCEWVRTTHFIDLDGHEALRAARRPKPPSLKEQALDSWDRLRNEVWCEEIDFDLDFIRRALEQLDD